MNFTGSVNSTGEELFTTDSQTFSGGSASSEDASYTSSAGLLTTETMVTLPPIVTGSLWEQSITAGLLMLVWIYVNLSNGFLLYVIRSEYSLHTPQYTVLRSYMICDTLYINLNLLHIVPVVISNNIHIMSDTASRILVTVSASFGCSAFHLVGLLAYERYCYFVTPLKYTRKFTKSCIYAAALIIHLCSLFIALAVDLIEPRVAVATVLTYQAAGLSIKITNVLYVVVYAIPYCTITILTLIKLRLLISKHKAQVHPVQLNVINEDQLAVSGIIVKPIRKALKMLGLVSGAFWLTAMPGFLLRIGLSSSGVTWAYTDHRVSLAMFALSRTSYLMISVLSSVINPIIYMCVLKELREAALKYMGIRRNNPEVHN